jgi:tetratricopeptide (TPR) repeat protein
LRRYLVLAAAALIAFGDSLRGSFHFDDYAMLASPRGPSSWLLQTRPLTQFTFWLNYLAGGTNAFGYHLVNLLLHVAVVCLLYQVLREFITEEIAFAAAALFAIHPIQSEAVAYVFARSSLLATLFCLLSWRSWARDQTALAIAYFAAALLSKEECVTFPFVLLLIGPRPWKPIAAMLGMAVVAGLHSGYATQLVAGSGAGFTAGVSPAQYLASQGFVICRYFRLLAVPWGFTIDPEIHPAAWSQILAWCVVIAALIYFRKNRWFVAGMILLIPSSSVFPATDLAADRRMYLPMIALTAAVAPLIWRWRYVAAPILVLLSIGRMEAWRTERALWEEAVERSPGKTRPRIQLARAVAPQQALEVLNGAPVNADVLTERGRVFLDLNQPAYALREFGQALALTPRDAHAINNRGVALLALGQAKAAQQDFERALSIDPGLEDARRNLARATAAAK